jgi:TonB family protein
MKTAMKLHYLLLLAFLVLSPSFASAQASVTDPSIEDFIDVTQEPIALTPIETQIHYPEAARRDRLEGKVIVAAMIDTSGRVQKVVVQKSDAKIFEEEAVRATKSTRFSPAMQGDKPVKVWLSQSINFKLNDRAYPAADSARQK